MASVIQPGWALLVVCSIMLLIVGWYLLHRSTQPAHSIRIVPLSVPSAHPALLWSPQPILTLNPANAAPAHPAASAAARDGGVLIEPPTCYDNPAHQLLCMGRIYNTLDVPVENLELNITVSSAAGGTFARTTLAEQRLIPPASYAAYHAHFGALMEEDVWAEAALSRTDYSHYLSMPLSVMLETTLPDPSTGQYILSGSVYNPHPQALQQVEIVGMLIDSTGRLSGYRVLRLPEGLSPEESRTIQLHLTAQTLDPLVSYRLTASGWNETHR